MRRKILVVEDEPELRMLIKQMLERNNTEVLVAGNGEEAFAMIKSVKDFNLIISDIGMPLMTGIELIKQVRNENLAMPFIFLTAYEKEEFMQEALKYAAFDFIVKPFNLSYLEESVDRALAIELVLNSGEDNRFAQSYHKFLEEMSRKEDE